MFSLANLFPVIGVSVMNFVKGEKMLLGSYNKGRAHTGDRGIGRKPKT
jgi:hypothetical protein